MKKERPFLFMSPQLIGTETSPYIRRMRIIRTPFFQIYFHRIYRPDNQREMHDHPFDFISFILRGWYGENVPRAGGGQKYVKRRWWNFKFAEGRHSIRTVSCRPVWTLVITGPERREWGFWVDGGTRWVSMDQYEKLNDA